MEEGIDTGEFKSLRGEKGIWFGDLNRVEFLAVRFFFNVWNVEFFSFFFFFSFAQLISQKSISFPISFFEKKPCLLVEEYLRLI